MKQRNCQHCKKELVSKPYKGTWDYCSACCDRLEALEDLIQEQLNDNLHKENEEDANGEKWISVSGDFEMTITDHTKEEVREVFDNWISKEIEDSGYYWSYVEMKDNVYNWYVDQR